MTAIASTLDCRLLCASVVAYTIGTKQPLSSSQPYFDAAGFTTEPTAITAGPDDINACFVGTNPDGVILSFRGTLPPDIHDIPSLIDWINDFDAVPIPVFGIPGKVHQGFWEAVDSLWSQIVPEVKNQMNAGGGNLPLYITGHSKGGAMAHLAAVRCKLIESLNPTAVFTYAGPRPGDIQFAAAYNAQIKATRYEYADDIVPHVPPSAAFISVLSSLPVVGEYFKRLQTWDYSSVGTLKFIDWSGQIVGDSPLLEAKRTLKLAELTVEGKFSQIADDHNSHCGGGYMTYICPTGVCNEP